MAENPKLGFESVSVGFSRELDEMGEKGIQKISIFNQRNSFQDRTEKSESFIVDMENLSYCIDKDITANSRITLQRSLSRKGSQRGGENNNNSTTIIATERDNIAAASASASPKAPLIGACTPEMPVIDPVMMIGTTDPISPQGQQIRIATTTAAESKSGSRRYVAVARRRASWVLDPWRILFFFATLSSMGTIILIYFTLSLSKLDGDDNSQSHYW